MNVYQTVEHFREEVGLNLLIDSLFGEEGADGGFPLPDGSDGGRQALVYDEYGLWLLSQAPTDQGADDTVRYFPFDVVTSCTLRQGPGAREIYQDHETSYNERTGGVLRSTTLDLTIADAVFRFDGREIAGLVANESFYPEILGDFFDIVRHCAAFGVPVRLNSTSTPVLTGAAVR